MARPAVRSPKVSRKKDEFVKAFKKVRGSVPKDLKLGFGEKATTSS